MHKIILSILLFNAILSCPWNYTEINNNCYYTLELDALQSMININQDLADYQEEHNITAFELFNNHAGSHELQILWLPCSSSLMECSGEHNRVYLLYINDNERYSQKDE